MSCSRFPCLPCGCLPVVGKVVHVVLPLAIVGQKVVDSNVIDCRQSSGVVHTAAHEVVLPQRAWKNAVYVDFGSRIPSIIHNRTDNHTKVVCRETEPVADD